MNLAEITSLNDQIQKMVREMNLPDDAARIIMEGIAQVKREAPCEGLPIGQKAPDFRLKNQHNDVVSLSETLAAGPVVLKFIRGAWCPFCNLDVAALQGILPQLEELNATVLVINPQKSGKSQQLQSNHSLGFDILSDEDQQVIRAYQLQFTVPPQVQKVYKQFGFNLPELTANGSWNLPVPATFVLDRTGVIRARHVDLDYLHRMEPADIVEAVRYLTDSVGAN